MSVYVCLLSRATHDLPEQSISINQRGQIPATSYCTSKGQGSYRWSSRAYRLVQGERPKFINESQKLTPFLGDRSCSFAHVLYDPLSPLPKGVFFFSPGSSSFFILYLGLKESQLPAKKNNTVRQRVDRDS